MSGVSESVLEAPAGHRRAAGRPSSASVRPGTADPRRGHRRRWAATVEPAELSRATTDQS
jgi:hypothetical protein